MPRLTLDFETFYDSKNKYSLRSMTTQQYVVDPRFHAQGLAVKPWGGASFWVDGPDIKRFLQSELGDPSQIDLCGWKLAFDGLILSHHYGWVPRSYVDGLGIARAVLGASLRSHGLDNVSKVLGREGKRGGGEALKAVDGIRNPQGALYEALKFYGVGDADDTEANIRDLEPFFPDGEFATLDMYTRMAADPKMRLDPVAIRLALEAVDKKKAEVWQAMLDAFAKHLPDHKPPTKSQLGSNPQFTKVWEGLTGLPAPTKYNDKGEKVVAFAKNDRDFFRQAQAHPLLQAVYKARLAQKSTIEKTRLEKLAKHAALGGEFPVPLNYAGALNTVSRASGADGLNMQNLPHAYEVDGEPQPGLRHCFVARPGHTLTVADSSGIEFIIAMTLCGQWDVLERREQGVREYSRMASKIFGREINKYDHPKEDKIGKVTVLQSQYQSGGETLATALFAQTEGDVMMSKEEAAHAVRVYRQEFDKVSAFWKRLGGVISDLCAGVAPDSSDLPITWFVEDGLAGFVLPSGHRVKYPDLKFTTTEQQMKGEDGEPLFDAQGRPLMRTRQEATYIDMRKGKAGEVGRAKLYPGKCLAAGTLVLQRPVGMSIKRWVPIESADPAQWVWDGAEWVRFDRVAAQGQKMCQMFNGVRMTEDHKVLTWQGMREARRATPEMLRPVELPGRDAPDPADALNNAPQTFPGRFWREYETYDLVNCGPRRQFMVMGPRGPFIVSNCLENICQALAGTVVNQQLAEIASHGFQCLLQVHDEGVFDTPLARAEECIALCERVMSTPPAWWSELKVGCEADQAPVYGLAK